MRSPPKKLKTSRHGYTFRQPYSAFVEDQDTGICHELDLVVGNTVQLSNGTLLTITHFHHAIPEVGDGDGHVDIVGKAYAPLCSTFDYGYFQARYKKEVYEMPEEGRFALSEIVRTVRLIRTNRVFPEMYDSTAKDEFYCRYKGTTSSLIRLSTSECTQGVATVQELRLRKPYGPQHGGRPQTRYTFGDAFCGIGGSANGARKAGLFPLWSFDKDPNCADLYQKNFPNTVVWQASVSEFLQLKEVRRVDVLHMSPPCQTWSMAHTREGVNDEANSDVIHSVGDLVKMVMPRVVVMEQVPGFCQKMDNKPYFMKTVKTFLELGYSVRWGFLEAADYGVPQTRKRLFIIAACPGQILPEMPARTHAPPGDPFLPSHISLETAFGNISPNDRLHKKNPYHYPRISDLSPTEPFHGTVTTSLDIPYWDETRPLTKRELARIQSFPDSHIFGVVHIARQIGNAVPPLLARRVFESVVRTLRKTDGYVTPEIINLE